MAIEGLEQSMYDNFAQGLDTSDDPRNIAENASPDTQNVRFWGQLWESRPGYRKHLNELSGGGFQGLEGWEKNDSLISAHAGSIYRDNGSAWVSVKSGLNATAEMGFQEYLGDIYYGNAVDAFGRIQHTSYTTSEPSGAPLGNILSSWAEKMWVAGNLANPRTLYYSRTALAANPEYIYDFGGAGSGSELIGKRGVITGLDTSKNALIIFKDREVYYIKTFNSTTLAPSLEQLSGAVGCVGRKAYVKVKDDIFFFTGTEVRVVAEYEGFPNLYTTSISVPIRRFFKGELDADQSDAVMAFSDEDNLLKLWVKSDGASNNDLCLVYHLDKENKTWTVDTGKPASQAVTFKDITYWTSATLGQAWEDEFGLTDDIAYISSYRWSKNRSMYGAIGRKKFRYYYLAGSFAPDTEITVLIYIDGALHKEITIDSNDVIGFSSMGTGAIGTMPIGTTPIGGVNVELRQFERLVKINKIGRYIQTYVGSSTLGGFYRITDEGFRYLPMPRAAERNY